MGYKDPETGGIKYRKAGTHEKMDIACGSCIGCRLDRSRMWAMRITHESTLYENGHGNSFITLTYRPKDQCTLEQLEKKQHVPDNWSLSEPQRAIYTDLKTGTEKTIQVEQSHFQGFMKRLRKGVARIDKEEGRPKRKIKYYQCGEYGEICKHGIDLSKVKCPLCNLGRPHHHAILFNVRPLDLVPYAQEGDTIRYTSPTLEKLWGYGFVDVGNVTQQSAAYCARYIMKKITGEKAEDHYKAITEDGEIQNLTPEYSSMSNGIGEAFYNRFEKDFFPSDETPVPGKGIVPLVPRYYTEKLKNDNPEMHEQVKNKRIRQRRQNQEEYSRERLYTKYKVKKAAITTLKRDSIK